jgi:AAA family ATP:ADP antiporter
VRRGGRGLVEHLFGRLLGAEVHAGERRIVLVLALELFALLTAYYVLKVVREPLILLGGGAVSRSYARGVQALLLLAVIPAYSALANRFEPRLLVDWVTTFFTACLLAFPVLAYLGVPLGFAFFVWLGIFSTLAIAQFWSLANDLFSEEEGKRLFPLVAAGGTFGAIVGSQLAARGMRLFGPFGLMLVAAGLLAVCIVLTRAARRIASHRPARPAARSTEVDGERDPRGGFALVVHDRYLLLIGLAVLALNVVNTTGDFVLAESVSAHASEIARGAPDPDAARQVFMAGFYGRFQTWVSVVTAAIQIVLVARVFKAIGVRRSLFVLPLLAFTGYGLFVAVPVIWLMAVVKVTENGFDYSLQNTIQQALFLPTSRDAKYKAKAATDTFFVRLGDMASTAVVFLGTLVGLGARGFALVNVAASAVWLALAASIARRHRAVSRIDHPAGTAPGSSVAS